MTSRINWLTVDWSTLTPEQQKEGEKVLKKFTRAAKKLIKETETARKKAKQELNGKHS